MSDFHLTDEEIDKVAAESFAGYDYGEVFIYLGIEAEPWVDGDNIESNDEKYWKKLRDRIDLAGSECCEMDVNPKATLSIEGKKTLLACRAYMRATANLKNPHTFTHPVWIGLDKVRNDWEFLQLFSLLFPYIWD